MALFFEMLVGHAVGDYVLQSSMMATAKSRSAKIFKTASPRFPPWYYWLLAHALVHGGIVYLITGSLVLGVVETALHAVIDYSKCEHWIGIHVDQSLHILCKVGYLYFI